MTHITSTITVPRDYAAMPKSVPGTLDVTACACSFCWCQPQVCGLGPTSSLTVGAYPAGRLHAGTLALALQMAAKDAACSEAPPTRNPSTSCLLAKSAEFLSFTEPPASTDSLISAFHSTAHMHQAICTERIGVGYRR